MRNVMTVGRRWVIALVLGLAVLAGAVLALWSSRPLLESEQGAVSSVRRAAAILLRWGLAILLILGVVYQFGRSYAELKANPPSFAVSWSALSLLALALFLFIAAEARRAWMGALGEPMGRSHAFRVLYLSNLGKYLPGGVWNFVGRMGSPSATESRRSAYRFPFCSRWRASSSARRSWRYLPAFREVRNGRRFGRDAFGRTLRGPVRDQADLLVGQSAFVHEISGTGFGGPGAYSGGASRRRSGVRGSSHRDR